MQSTIPSFLSSACRFFAVTLATGVACTGVSALAQQVSARPTSFRLDSDEFPIGMFSVDSSGAMAQVKTMGVSYVQTYGQGDGNTPGLVARDVGYLDSARKHGLKVMFNLDGARWVGMDNGVAGMLKLVNAVKAHPALGFWYFYDEPDGKHTPEQLMPFYQALKKATPEIPVAIATAWSKKWYAYNGQLDALMIDTYPVQHRPFPNSSLGVMTRFTERAISLGKPVIPINQCFNWRVLAGERELYRGSPASKLRFPNQTEIRYWCFSGLAQGVRGMFWWSYCRSGQAGYGWINGEFKAVLREFRQYADLVSPAHECIVLKQPRDTNVMMALWERPGKSCLVAVNSSALAQPLNGRLEGKLLSATLSPWGTTRDTGATLENGKLSAGQAKPWEVFVWEVKDLE